MNQRDDSASAPSELDKVLADYLRAKESGETPNRAEWLQRYPELADELAEFFDDEDQFDRIADDLGADEPIRPGLDRTTDFRFRGSGDSSKDSTLSFQTQSPQVNVDRYIVKDLHGRGGMGEVWLAKDEQIGRQVAIKTLRPGRAEQRERFLVEAQITGQLEHPSIIPTTA